MGQTQVGSPGPPTRACRGLQAATSLPSSVTAGHAVHYLHRSDAHGADAPQQVYNPLLVVGEAIRVELLRYGGVPGLLLLVLVQYPLQGRPAAQPVAPGDLAVLRLGWSCRPGLCCPAPCRAAGTRALRLRPCRTRFRGYGSADSKPMCRSRSSCPIFAQYRSRGRGAGAGTPGSGQPRTCRGTPGSWSTA